MPDNESSTPQGETAGALSFAQQRLWLFNQLDPNNAAYNVPFGIRLTGSIDRNRLQQAIQLIVDRHETLRTAFRVVRGAPMQIIHPSVAVKLVDVQVSGGPDEITALARKEAGIPFEVSKAPLLRTTLARVNASESFLLVTLHHLVFDGWSVGLFFNELVSNYRALSDGKQPDTAELDIQYLDFAEWERETLQGDRLQELLGFWKEQMRGAPSLLELPTDRPRPKFQSNAGRCEGIDLPKEQAAALQSFCQQEGVTSFMVAMAVWQTLLHRYSRQEDIVVGSPVANRTRSETEGLIGFFANTMLVRGAFSREVTFRDLVKQIREGILKGSAHQEAPFDKLVEELQPERNLGHNPLFQVMLSAYETPRDEQAGGATFSFVDIETVTAKFDLTLFFIQSPEGLKARIEYATALFDTESIRRMLGHFSVLLSAALAKPDQRVAALPLLTAKEEQQIVRDWNDTAVDYKQPSLIHTLFEARAAENPDAVALRFGGASMTYAEVNARANQLAHLLIKHGVKPDTFVAISMERSFELVISLLAAMKAGGAYAPVDPANPPDRMAFMIKDAAAPVLLTQARLANKLPESSARVIHVDDCPELSAQSRENPNVPLTPENLCYTIYTSGSTGVPKGAMNNHRGVTNRLLWGQATYKLTPQDRVLQKTPYSFDVSAWEFFWPLTCGAQLVVAAPGLHGDPAGLVQLINSEQITIIHFVPSMLQAFLDDPRSGSCPSIKKVFCSGEALPASLQQRFFRTMKAELHNLYGPTEASIEVTYWQCQPDDRSAIVPIGWAVANTRIYVLDAEMNATPVNVPGELHIGGIALARGYHERPELTRDRFVPNPFVPGERLYKTGDLAAFRSDGAVIYLGRLDHQVKIRGLRVELGEIEAGLLQHPQIKEAVVLAREDTPGDQRLVAYCVPQASQEPTADELKELLQQKMPAYMIPAAFVMLPAFPINPNGKLDRKALPAPAFKAATQVYTAPRNEVEEKLAAIWREVLNVEKVGIHDNFFDLGGHSLLAMQVVSRMRSSFGTDVPLLKFFTEPTLAGLSEFLAANQNSSPASSRIERVSAAPAPDVANLSDDEVDRLLAELSKGS